MQYEWIQNEYRLLALNCNKNLPVSPDDESTSEFVNAGSCRVHNVMQMFKRTVRVPNALKFTRALAHEDKLKVT